MAKSIPTLAEFEQRLEEEVGVVEDAHARGAITRLTRRKYGEEVKERQEKVNKPKEEESERGRFPEPPSEEERDFDQRVWVLDQINDGIKYSAMMHERNFPFWEWVETLKLREENVRVEKAERGARVNNPGEIGTVAHATNFTSEDVRLAIAYLEDILKGMEEAQ